MSGGADVAYWAIIAGIPILAAALCAGMLVVLLPWLKSYALSQPVDRSLHREPTPQGGGLGVILATFDRRVACRGRRPVAVPPSTLALLSALTAAVALLTLVGLLDDMHGLSPAPRLLVQCLAVGLILVMLPADARLVSALPLWVERACVLLVGVWFVNLVNFMDGIDWMTVAEAVPITAAIVVLGLAGVVPPLAMLVALALLGAVLGFAPFNRPVARLFLGDVGSLPIGLMLGWLLLLLATSGHLAAALLLPLYYLADATITLRPAHRPARGGLASASQPLLSARRRRRDDGARRRRARIRNQCGAGGTGDGVGRRRQHDGVAAVPDRGRGDGRIFARPFCERRGCSIAVLVTRVSVRKSGIESVSALKVAARSPSASATLERRQPVLHGGGRRASPAAPP